MKIVAPVAWVITIRSIKCDFTLAAGHFWHYVFVYWISVLAVQVHRKAK